MRRLLTALLLTALGVGAFGCDDAAVDAACDGSACAKEDASSSSGVPHAGGHDPGSSTSSSDAGADTSRRSDSGTAFDGGGESNGTSCAACQVACTDNWECDGVSAGGSGAGLCYDGHCVDDVNGCTVANSTDLLDTVTASQTAPIEVDFPVDGSHYSPRCIKVTMGTKVRFSGSFSSHPLVGGLIVGGGEQPASTGPFTTKTETGTSKDFLMDDCAAYPYYCNVHGPSGMHGAVIVLLP